MNLRTASRRRLKKRYKPYIWSSCRVAMRAMWREVDAARRVSAAYWMASFMDRAAGEFATRPLIIDGIDVATNRIEIEIDWKPQ